MFKSVLNKFSDRFLIDSHTAAYIAHNRKKWGQKTKASKQNVILIDLFEDNTVLHTYSYVANYLGKKLNARLAAFHFGKGPLDRWGVPRRRMEQIYSSFGAPLELSFSGEAKFAAEADAFATKKIKELRTKYDVLDISLFGLKVGDLIYQSYLRRDKATIDFADPRLHKVIRDAYLIAALTDRYFTENNVSAIFISHFIFIHYGVVTRFAAKSGVPIYKVHGTGYRDGDCLTLLKPDPNRIFQQFRYWNYHRDFLKLPKEQQEKGILEGREILQNRLRGGEDKFMVVHRGEFKGAWGESGSKEKFIKPSPRKKVLLLLSCFFDGPHYFGDSLFPDFYEWTKFTLASADYDRCDWYVKPHPAALPANALIIAELKREFPRANFLPKTASNPQLIAEGIDVAISIQGTAIHEFAYSGIPVIAASGNMHIAYDFYIQPKSVAEYRDFVKNAHEVSLDIDKRTIEEFIYMNSVYYFQSHNPDMVELFDSGCEKYVKGELGGNVQDSRIFSYLVANHEKVDEKRLMEFFDWFFADNGLGSAIDSQSNLPYEGFVLQAGRELITGGGHTANPSVGC